MEYTIFYSWQMDAPSVTNKSFLRAALDQAVAQITTSTVRVEPSPRVDSGMDDIAGTPEVATVMFEKIKDSAIFLGDVSLVGVIDRTNDQGAKTGRQKTLNPNVAVEMGYAGALVGWDRIICVMNEEFGARREQPFDVRNRRFPINYSLSLKGAADSEKKTTIQHKLANEIRGAIEAIETNELRKVANVQTQLDVRCLELMGVFGRHISFPEPNPAPPLMDVARFHSAAVRLLELKVLWAHVDPNISAYAYHWTHLGVELLYQLKFRPRPAGGGAVRKYESTVMDSKPREP